MKIKSMRLLLLSTAVVLLVACGGSSEPLPDIDATVEARVALEAEIAELKAAGEALAKDAKHTTAIELDSVRKEELLALADNRDAWFLASSITTEALEGLYGSWSVICRNETSLADYKGAVYEFVRPLVLGMIEMELEDVQKADRYYEVVSWNPPWVYVQQTWKLDDKLIFGPESQLYLIESGAWRYHDC